MHAVTGRWWAARRPSGDVVVYPVGDLIGHDVDDGASCVCGPRVEPVQRCDGVVVQMFVHASLDGRERGEPGGDG